MVTSNTGLIDLLIDLFFAHSAQSGFLRKAPAFPETRLRHSPPKFSVLQDDIPHHGYKEVGWSLLAGQQDRFPNRDGLQGLSPSDPKLSQRNLAHEYPLTQCSHYGYTVQGG